MKDSKEILAVGSIAYDSLKTPNGNRERILGGSCTYFSVAASYYTNTSIIGVVGDDFDQKSWDLFKKYNINTDCVEIANGQTFSWGGEYNHNYSKRETLFTNLGVFEHFNPSVAAHLTKSRCLFLGNIHPAVQSNVLEQMDSPELVVCDTMNYWIDQNKKELLDLLTDIKQFKIQD